MRNRLILSAKLLLAAVVIYWLLRSGALEFDKLAGLRDRWQWFALANVPYGLAQVVAAVRWRALLRVGGIEYSFREVMDLTFIGLFFNQMIFGSTGGDVVRGYAVAAEQPGRRSEAVMSVLVDRILGLIVLLVMTLAAAGFRAGLLTANPNLALLVGLVAFSLLGAVVAMGLWFSPLAAGWLARPGPKRLLSALLSRLPARSLFERLAEAFEVYGRRPRDLWWASLQSLLLHVGIVAMNLCLVLALVEGPFDWVAVLFLVPLAHVAMTLPINPPGAIGTAEAIYAYLFSMIGISQGGLICILQRLILYLWAIPGALIWVTRRREIRTSPVGSES